MVLYLHLCRLVDGLKLLFSYISEIFIDPGFITTLIGSTGPAAGIGAHAKQVVCKRLYDHVLGCSLSLSVSFSLFAGSKLSLIPAKMQDGKTGLQNKRVTGLAGRLQLHTPEHVYLFEMTEFRTCDEKGKENSRLLCRPTALIENV